MANKKLLTDEQNRSYLSYFDLNERDMNGHTGLHAAVVANHYEVCLYLLNELRFLQVSRDAINQLRLKRQTNIININNKEKNILSLDKKKIFEILVESEVKSLKSNSNNNNNDTAPPPQVSLFDHFKNVFMDPRSYDPYVVNYTTSDNEDENGGGGAGLTAATSVGTFIYNSLIGESISSTGNNNNNEFMLSTIEAEKQKTFGDLDSENGLVVVVVHFSPLNINTYSKFGRSCLHDAIRNGNVNLVKVLIENGANPNAHVYDINLSVVSSPENLTGFPVIANCLSEAIMSRDEIVFILLLNKYV